jgi:hypothetical protein
MPHHGQRARAHRSIGRCRAVERRAQGHLSSQGIGPLLAAGPTAPPLPDRIVRRRGALGRVHLDLAANPRMGRTGMLVAVGAHPRRLLDGGVPRMGVLLVAQEIGGHQLAGR